MIISEQSPVMFNNENIIENQEHFIAELQRKI
jgi:hypothetical protein